MRRLPRRARELLARTRADRRTIGFPGAAGLDLSGYAALLRPGAMLNNAGDPFIDGLYPAHTKFLEREVLRWLADLFAAEVDRWWGYIASGSSEGTEYALYTARRRLPDAVVYTSTAVHFATVNVCDRLGLPLVQIPADQWGELRYGRLREVVDRTRPAVVVAHAGTGMTEAVDDVTRVHDALHTAGIIPEHRWVHVDGALAAVPLALLAADGWPRVDFRAGATSIVTSGHKFFGLPVPCAAVLVDRAAIPDRQGSLQYTGSYDTTVSCSRPGLAVLWWWHTIHQLGRPGLVRWAEDARAVAAYTEHALAAAGWPAWRAHQHAFTVVLPTPPPGLLVRWPLAHDPATGLAHVVCMPGVTRHTIDEFVADLGRFEDAGLAARAKALVAIPAVPADRDRPHGGVLGTGRLG